MQAAARGSQSVRSLLDQGIASLTNFLAGVIVARSCAKSELGLYMLGFAVVQFLLDMQTAVIATPYMIYAPRLSGRDNARYTGSTMIHQLTLCAGLTLALAGGAWLTSLGIGPQGLHPVLCALTAVSSLPMLREFARRISFTQLKAGGALAMDSSVAAVQLGGMLLLAHYHMLTASRAYLTLGTACGAAFVGWLWTERRNYELHLGGSWEDLKKNWGFGKFSLASSMLWTLGMNLYPWFIAAFHGTASTGVWAACLGAAQLGNPLVLGFQNFMGPRVSHVYAQKGARKMQSMVMQLTLLFSLPMLLYCIGGVALGGWTIARLYGHGFTGYGTTVGILACNLAVSAIGVTFSKALFAIERADIDFLVNFVSLAILLTAGVWMVKSYSVIGAACALLVANFVSGIVRFAALRVMVRRADARAI